jgi:hypothetical protein
MNMKKELFAFILLAIIFKQPVQSQVPYTASFVASLGTDTVIVETYNMVNNHLYGKAFIRYPEDYIGVFDVHFYPDGSIRTFNIEAMNPDNSSVPFNTKGRFSYRQNMLCENDTCTWFASSKNGNGEYMNKHAAHKMDFVGGWTPILSLIEWNCTRLIKSGNQNLPLTMINDYIGVRNIGISKGGKDTIIFGGPFLEYTRIHVTPGGRIISYDGTGTPWNYLVTKLPPVNIDEIARRMSKKPEIGIPSPEEVVQFKIAGSNIEISYGRPSKRGRKIFGGVVPYDSIWRTGASHPTKINFEDDVMFGETLIPKGRYSLYTIPRKDSWSLIFNTDLDTWPTDPNRSKDFKTVPLKLRKPPQQTEKFTIDIKPTQTGGNLSFTWDETEAFTEFYFAKK